MFNIFNKHCKLNKQYKIHSSFHKGLYFLDLLCSVHAVAINPLQLEYTIVNLPSFELVLNFWTEFL